MIQWLFQAMVGAGRRAGGAVCGCRRWFTVGLGALLCLIAMPSVALAQNYKVDLFRSTLEYSPNLIQDISGLDVDSQKRIHVYEREKKRIRTYTSDGVHIKDRPTGASGNWAPTAVMGNGTMVVADNAVSKFRAIDFDGNPVWETAYPAAGFTVEKVGISGDESVVAYAVRNSPSERAVWRLDSSGDAMSSWAAPSSNGRPIILRNADRLIWVTGSSPNLQLNETTLAGTPVRTVGYQSPLENSVPADAVGDGNGGFWIAESRGAVVHIDGQGNVLTTIGSRGLGAAQFLNPIFLESADGSLLVGDVGRMRLQYVSQTGVFGEALTSRNWIEIPYVNRVKIGADRKVYFGSDGAGAVQINPDLLVVRNWWMVFFDANDYYHGTSFESFIVNADGELIVPSAPADNIHHFAVQARADGFFKQYIAPIPSLLYGARSVQGDAANNVFLSVYGDTSEFLNKYSPNGDLLWSRSLLPGYNYREIISSEYGTVLFGTGYSNSRWNFVDPDGNTRSVPAPFDWPHPTQFDRNGDILTLLDEFTVVKHDDQGNLVSTMHLDTSAFGDGTGIQSFAVRRDGLMFAVGANGRVARLVPEWTETTPPTSLATVDPAAPASGWHLGPVDVVFTSADDRHGSGLKQFVLDVDGTVDILPDPLPSTVARTFTTAGDHVIRYHGVDHAGNQEATQTLHVKIDLAVPQVQANVTNRVLTLTATDDASGVEWIRYRVDNGPELTYSGPVSLPLTAKVVRYQARDFSGRLSAQQSRVVGQFLKRVVFAPTSATAGASVVVKVELLAAAPAGGIELNLVSTRPDVLAVPSTVTIPAGASSASFTRTLGPVPGDTSVQVTASFANTSTTGGLVVRQSSPKSVAVAPSTLFGGESAVGKVVLAAKAPVGGQVVQLESLDPAVLTVPATVTVPAGALSAAFAVGSQLVESETAVLLVAKIGSRSVLTTITVRRNGPVSLTVSPSKVTGGTSVTGKLTLARPAPAGGLTVVLASTDSEVAVPASVVVPSGSRTATFPITTAAVAQDLAAAVRAERAGLVVDATLAVLAARLTSVSVSPNRLTGGAAATGTVTLTGPAPAGGLTVDLSVSNAAAGVPSSVTVPAGARTATFPVSTAVVPSDTLVTIAAVSNLDTKETVVTVRR